MTEYITRTAPGQCAKNKECPLFANGIVTANFLWYTQKSSPTHTVECQTSAGLPLRSLEPPLCSSSHLRPCTPTIIIARVTTETSRRTVSIATLVSIYILLRLPSPYSTTFGHRPVPNACILNKASGCGTGTSMYGSPDIGPGTATNAPLWERFSNRMIPAIDAIALPGDKKTKHGVDGMGKKRKIHQGENVCIHAPSIPLTKKMRTNAARTAGAHCVHAYPARVSYT